MEKPIFIGTTASTDLLPEYGIMASLDTIPVGAGFLRHCEGGVAIFDGLIANRDLIPSHRDVVLDGIVLHLLKKAKELDIKYILAFSFINEVFERSPRNTASSKVTIKCSQLNWSDLWGL